MNYLPESISREVQYVILLFVLLVLPRIIQRFRIPSAVSCVALGALAGVGFGVLRDDAVVDLLSTFGIVSLFLFAGLDVEFGELRRNASFLGQHLLIRGGLLVIVTLIVKATLGLSLQPALLFALALTTPSTGFILDSLGSLGVTPPERSWIKTKAIATELVALAVLFTALQTSDPLRVLISTTILAAMIVLLPLVFRFFASVVLPHAPKSEFAFLLMTAVLCGMVTLQLGAYYLVGAFVVGITAQRFRERMPAMASEQMVHAIELFASFFVPFYFFHAGVKFERDDFTPDAILLGMGFVLVLVPLQIVLVALHRRIALGEPFKRGARIGVSIVPTLVFTIVIAHILQERFSLSQTLFGALMVYTVANTLIPGLVLRVPAVDISELRAPHVEVVDPTEDWAAREHAGPAEFEGSRDARDRLD